MGPEGVEGGGGGRGGELINLPTAKKFFIAAVLLWDEDDMCTVVFYSVIYNSVGSIFSYFDSAPTPFLDICHLIVRCLTVKYIFCCVGPIVQYESLLWDGFVCTVYRDTSYIPTVELHTWVSHCRGSARRFCSIAFFSSLIEPFMGYIAYTLTAV